MATVSTESYNIYIDESMSLLSRLINQLNPSALFVLVDTNTRRYCLGKLTAKIPIAGSHIITIPAGEAFKTLVSCHEIWEELLKHGADRRSLVINLGGGVICDMGGFAASTYMRGIPFIHMPTSLLAQVDASIGGKTGVDFKHYKNLIGRFAYPEYVWIDSSFLETLPEKEYRSGMAEVIKHALISSDSMWQQIKRTPVVKKVDVLHDLIRQSIIIKNRVVEKDPLESGVRKILNFGHTIGHAIESVMLTSPQPLTHGEAVAAGMLAESWISLKSGNISSAYFMDIEKLLTQIYHDIFPLKLDVNAVMSYVFSDKKNISGKIMMVLLEGPGEASYDNEISRDLVLNSLEFLQGNQ